MFQVSFFFTISCRIVCKNIFNLFVYFFLNTKIKVKSFECPKSIKILKKIILGTSDAWSTIRLSNRPSDPAWIYLRLTDFWCLVRGDWSQSEKRSEIKPPLANILQISQILIQNLSCDGIFFGQRKSRQIVFQESEKNVESLSPENIKHW